MKITTPVFLLGLTLLSAPAAVRGAGTASALFLREEHTARITAMGGASAALDDDAGALYFNPAGLGYADKHRFAASAWKGLDEKSRDAFVTGVYDGGGAGGFSLSYLIHTSGKEEIFDLEGSERNVELASDYALGAGWGHKLSGNLSAGGRLKFVKSTLAESYGARAATFDAGLLMKTNNKRFSIGAGVQNGAGKLKYISEKDPLPQIVYGGAAMRLGDLDGKQLLLTADLHKAKDESSSDAHTGLEYRLNILALRLGAKRVSGDNSLTAGGGIRAGLFSVDYGFQAAGELDQPIHKFTLNLAFGGHSALRAAAAPETPVQPPEITAAESLLKK